MTAGIRRLHSLRETLRGPGTVRRPQSRWAGLVAACLIALPTLGSGARSDPLTLAVLGPEGADTPGDRLSVTRPFGSWSLQCDLSVSQNKRLCRIEQVLQRPDGAVLWRLARATDDRNVLILSLPLNLNTALGLTIKLDGFATTVSAWTCGTACLAILPLSGPLQSLLFSASTVEMSYTTKAGKPVVLSGTMAGFRQAIQAAAEDPFGKRVPPPPPKIAAKPAEATGSVGAERARKPKAAPAPPPQ